MQQKLNLLKTDVLEKIQTLKTEQEIIFYRNSIVGKN
jgi:hypothetical protein